MFHGRTVHGVERLAGTAPPQPLSYYSAAGPLGDIMRAIAPRSRDIGVIGLGIGSTGCYALPGQSWTFYELDGLGEDLAGHSGLFHSLTECAPQAKVVLGDGRLNLENERAGLYDILVLDAFSSDAIPIHLLTREGFATYVHALKPHGALAIHIANRHSHRLRARTCAHPSLALDGVGAGSADLGGLARSANWTFRPAVPATKLWTDDFSNILSALR
jgi:hypothetical protein